MPSVKRAPAPPLTVAQADASANKTPAPPLATQSSRLSTPKTGASPASAATAQRAKGAYAPASRTATLKPPGTGARIVRAFTSGFPFAGLEYVIFLGLVENTMRLAVPAGLIFLGLASGLFFLQQQAKL
ncbi:MAG: hypothetical protein H0X24_14905, partial [Ktedonobacterales bacterium]|nr:hypothetical protein [Ktedonobacterales bacterium]